MILLMVLYECEYIIFWNLIYKPFTFIIYHQMTTILIIAIVIYIILTILSNNVIRKDNEKRYKEMAEVQRKNTELFRKIEENTRK